MPVEYNKRTNWQILTKRDSNIEKRYRNDQKLERVYCKSYTKYLKNTEMLPHHYIIVSNNQYCVLTCNFGRDLSTAKKIKNTHSSDVDEI